MKKAAGVAGWILLGAVVGGAAGGAAGYVMGSGEAQVPVVVTAVVTPIVVTAAPDASDEAAPKVVVKNYGLAIRSGPGAVYEIIGNAPMESEYRIVGRNAAGDWWQILFVDAEGEEAQGWLYAPFEKAVNAGAVDVVDTPPTPTPASR